MMTEPNNYTIKVRKRFDDWQAFYECSGSGRRDRWTTGTTREQAIEKLRNEHPELAHAEVENE